MTQGRGPEGQKGPTFSFSDLRQIKDAVSELRASCPESVLADLVEEKIRVMESGSLEPRPESPPAWNRRIFS